jgi:chemotaxis protein methyltransferase CheR
MHWKAVLRADTMSNTVLIADQVSDQQLARYAEMIYEKTGIVIPPQKKTLLSNRLRRRLRATGIGGYDEYLKRLKALPLTDAEWTAFLQEITTHESYLFRDTNQWDWLRQTYLPEIAAQARSGKRSPTLRVWSAACSTGDEPYTIACCIADALVNHAVWKINIVGTDIGAGAIAHAEEGKYGRRAMQGVSQSYRTRFFEKAGDDGSWTVKPALRKWIVFKRHNLLEPLREPPFDLVFVKNVLIYFDAASKAKVIAHVLQAMKPGGVLVTGPAEGVTELLRSTERLQGWLHRKPAK